MICIYSLSYGQGFLIGAQLQDSNVEPLMELVEVGVVIVLPW